MCHLLVEPCLIVTYPWDTSLSTHCSAFPWSYLRHLSVTHPCDLSLWYLSLSYRSRFSFEFIRVLWIHPNISHDTHNSSLPRVSLGITSMVDYPCLLIYRVNAFRWVDLSPYESVAPVIWSMIERITFGVSQAHTNRIWLANLNKYIYVAGTWLVLILRSCTFQFADRCTLYAAIRMSITCIYVVVAWLFIFFGIRGLYVKDNGWLNCKIHLSIGRAICFWMLYLFIFLAQLGYTGQEAFVAPSVCFRNL
jgi:hypothetical protein